MANQVLKLYVDTAEHRLVSSQYSSTGARKHTFVQGDTVTLVIKLLEPNPTGAITAPYSVVSVSGLTCRVGIGTPSAGTGSGAPGIFQNTFTANTTDNTLTGTLYITPSTVATLLGSATAGDSTLEIEVSEAGNHTTVYSGPITLKAELIEGAAAAPTPSDEYMTKAESVATFAKRYGSDGDTITLASSDGTKQAILYVDNDGVFHADIVTI